MGEPAPAPAPRYVQPGWFARTIFNPAVAALTRAGISVWGSRELPVRVAGEGELRVGKRIEVFRATEVVEPSS